MPRKALNNKDRESSQYCQFCKMLYETESGFINHVCKKKGRWLDKDERRVQLGFMAYRRYYELTSPRTRTKTYEDFMDANLYPGFVKFGEFLKSRDIIEPTKYVDFVIKAKLKLKEWSKDEVYEEFVVEQTKRETPEHALERNMLLMEQWGIQSGKPWKSFFKEVNPQEALKWIMNGRISPWVLFTVPTAKELLIRMTPEQLKMVDTRVDKSYWGKKINSNYDAVRGIREVCEEVGI